MKKILVLSVLMLMLMVVNLSATDTRVLTMGENNTILQDEANIWLFPSRINQYPNILTAEISDLDNKYLPEKVGYVGDQPISRIGINWKFGGDKPWILGTYLHNNAIFYDYMVSMGTPSSSIMPYHGGPYLEMAEESYSNKRIDLFWGKMFGQNAFGFRLGMIHSSDKDEKPTDLSERGFTKYDFQAGLTMMEDKLDIAVGLELLTFTYKETYTTPDTGNYDYYKPEGNNTMFARFRYFYEYSPTYTFVPHGEIRISKYEYSQNYWDSEDEEEELNYTNKFNYTVFELGAGMHYTPATNVLAVIDFGFYYGKMKRESAQVITEDSSETNEWSWTYNMLPYFRVGLEAEVFSWMDLRLGATSYWTKYTYEGEYFGEETTSKYEEKYPYNTTYLGLGFNWNRLFVDCYVDPELFMDGFHFISGVDSKADGMNFQISAKYNMF